MENQHSKNILLILSIVIFFFACKNEEARIIDKTKTVEKSNIVRSEPTSQTNKNQKRLDQDSISSVLKIDSTNVISENRVEELKTEKPLVDVLESKAKEVAKKPKVKKKKVYPKMEFENEVFDFGEITEGDTINYKFKFKNTGRKTLEIKSADATCGCTQPSYPFLGVEPGDSGNIGVRYISVGKSGHQEATITIKSNADYPTKKLLLKGMVNKRKKEKVDEESKQ